MVGEGSSGYWGRFLLAAGRSVGASSHMMSEGGRGGTCLPFRGIKLGADTSNLRPSHPSTTATQPEVFVYFTNVYGPSARVLILPGILLLSST